MFSVKVALEALLHTTLLLGPLFSSGILHQSDSLIRQIPSAFDPSNNITEVGFGIRHFSIIFRNDTEVEDIRFSDEQEDALGREHNAAHIVFHVLHGFMWMFLVLSVMVPAVYYGRQWWKNNRSGPKALALAKLTGWIAKVYLPALILLTLLMVVPYGLLTQSNLCNSEYVELGYAMEVDNDSSDDRDFGDEDHHCHDDDFEGTYAKLHFDVDSRCEFATPSGLGFLVTNLSVLPLLLFMQHCVLRRRAAQFQAESQLAEMNREEFGVEQGNDDGNAEEEVVKRELADDETSVSSSESTDVEVW